MTDVNQLTWLGDVPIEVQAAAAGPTLRMSEILALRKGSVIGINLRAGENSRLRAGRSICLRYACNEGLSTCQAHVYMCPLHLVGIL